VALLVSGQFLLALNIAVFALIVLYFLHSLVFLLLPRLNRELYSQINLGLPHWLLRTSAIVSLVSMGTMILVQMFQDIVTLRTQSLSYRIANHSLTSIELIVAWGLLGIVMYAFSSWRARRENVEEGQDRPLQHR
jgi:hypothetical protein